jgi:GDP-L-fucose synthase
VAICGGNGFIGRHVTSLIDKSKYEVFSLGKSDYDLMNEKECDNLFKRVQPQHLIFLSAVCGGLKINRDQGYHFGYSNLKMGANIINAAAKYGELRTMTNIGTVCSIERDPELPINEESLWKGKPEKTNFYYGAAKLMIMELGNAARENHGLPFKTLILSNCYGEYDNFHPYSSHIIPALINKFHIAKYLSRKAVRMMGDGKASRDLLYAGNAAKAIIRAMEFPPESPHLMIGTSIETTIEDLAFQIATMIGFEGDLLWGSSSENGQPRRVVSYDRASRELGWSPSTTLYDGLKATYNYYLNEILGKKICWDILAEGI